MSKLPFQMTLTSLFWLFVVGVVYAEPIDEERARSLAVDFFGHSTQDSRSRVKARQLLLRSDGHDAGYYIFDRPEGGIVFVADDDAMGYAVLGYTDRGSYNMDSIPVGLQDWLDQMSVLMNAVHEGKINKSFVKSRAREVVVEPLITTQWNQQAPYNNLCPTMPNGQRCITGCVATAMAQVMNYWKWPEHGYGYVSYTDADGCGKFLSQNLSANYYEWSLMKDSYSSGYTQGQATAVATLMRDCGYAVHMCYTDKASAASVSPRIMSKYFHYTTAAIERYSSDYTDEQWHALLRQDLNSRRPVLYSGQSEESGHQFIIDGYDANDYYHVNWGWGGYTDGWFRLTKLGDYNDSQDMINDLQPDYDGDVFSYNLSSDSVLTITGSGPMPQDYEMDTAPWSEMCHAIRKIVIGSGITAIPSNFGSAYESNGYFSNLRELELPEGLISIGNDAFSNTRLTSVQLPSTILSMDNAFWYSDLKSLHLPKGLISYKDNLPRLSELTVDEANPWLSVEDNILYDKERQNLLFIPGGLSRITIAETTRNICYAYILRLGVPILSKCAIAPSLPSWISDYPNYYIGSQGTLLMPYDSEGYDEWRAYLNTGWTILSYTDINHIPDLHISWEISDKTLILSGWGAQNSDEYYYYYAPYYSEQNRLNKLVVEEGVSGLCWAAYWGYEFQQVVLPSTLTSIDSYCFGYNYMLNDITCYASKAPSLDDEVFTGLPTYGTLHVPQGSDYSSWLNNLPSGWDIEYFTPEPLAVGYLYTGEQRDVYSLTEWESLQKQYPNSVAVINPRQVEWAYFTGNMLIADETVEGGYRCPYFRLTDLTYDHNNQVKAPQTGFCSPFTFSIDKGNYKRKIYEGYHTVCLPFKVDESELPENCRMFTYSHYDTDKGDVVFTPLACLEPGQACVVKSEADVVWKTDLSGKTITILQAAEADSMMRGTFVTTDDYAQIGYSPRVKDNIFAPLALSLHPFRACLLIANPSAPHEIQIRLGNDVKTDAVKGVTISDPKMSTPIYSLDGIRISAPAGGQPYIQNGKIIVR